LLKNLKKEVPMSRIANRQLAILQILDNGRKVKIREICERTESSRSTILRDLLDLSAYYPIFSERGRNGGVWMEPAAVVGRLYWTKAELVYYAAGGKSLKSRAFLRTRLSVFSTACLVTDKM